MKCDLNYRLFSESSRMPKVNSCGKNVISEYCSFNWCAVQYALLDGGKPNCSLAVALYCWPGVAKKRGMLDDSQNLYEQSLDLEHQIRGVNVDH